MKYRINYGALMFFLRIISAMTSLQNKYIFGTVIVLHLQCIFNHVSTKQIYTMLVALWGSTCM